MFSGMTSDTGTRAFQGGGGTLQEALRWEEAEAESVWLRAVNEGQRAEDGPGNLYTVQLENLWWYKMKVA